MHIIAFILAIIAVICFAIAARGGVPANPPPWHFGWLGLMFLTIAWMVQLILVGGSKLVVD